MDILVMHAFPADDLARLQKAAPGIRLHVYPKAGFGDLPRDVLSRVEVLYTSAELPDPDIVPALKWVQVHSAGVDHLLNHPLFARRDSQNQPGITLTTASGVHAINMSEYILMMMLALAHRMNEVFRMKHAAHWNASREVFTPRELHGATVGLIGYGAIGRQTAQACKALGMCVLALRQSASGIDHDVTFYRREQIGEFLSQCDFLVLSAPLTERTYHIIDRAALAAMKPAAYVVNIARGDLVDEPALIDALQEGRLAGAALDVFAREPLPDDSPLWHMDNVFLTPHIAGITPAYDPRAAEIFADNIHRFAVGEPLRNKVDFARGY